MLVGVLMAVCAVVWCQGMLPELSQDGVFGRCGWCTLCFSWRRLADSAGISDRSAPPDFFCSISLGSMARHKMAVVGSVVNSGRLECW